MPLLLLSVFDSYILDSVTRGILKSYTDASKLCTISSHLEIKLLAFNIFSGKLSKRPEICVNCHRIRSVILSGQCSVSLGLMDRITLRIFL